MAVAALLFTAPTSSAAETAAPVSETPSLSTDAAKPAKPSLQKGMDAATIIRIIGKPEQIKPMNSPEGKAETWIYRRLLSRTVTQQATGTREMPSFDGSIGNQLGSRSEVVYTNVMVETYQVTHLLMFNDQLVVAKQWREQTRSYNP